MQSPHDTPRGAMSWLALLLLTALLLTACATPSTPVQLPPVMPPPALMSADNETSWQSLSQRLGIWLQSARQRVIDSLNRPENCAATHPKSARCL